ncbi:DUF1206 domain-containing protein [Halomonas marinisediminis]|uniref:DUF1206 domain-containing protein n=1 Tax=Halomonas marinisediminis TaxID=2546095 RepID=A0ABY2D8H2_9GAMM|nr:DUF1206 domain-containing protein [Halomonas marinisediminis]TDB04229.1 DUF1206 domain-containing protein [Halomonas marinisediminis]
MTPPSSHPKKHLKRGLSVAARIGYIAKGVVYLLIGGLAVLAATGLGGEHAGTKESINQLIQRPFGDTMVGLLGAGLFAYALWRLLQALLDSEDAGRGAKGVVTRLGFTVSSLTHASLGVYCIDLLRNAAMSSGDTAAQDRTALLMSHQGGVILVFCVGLAFLGVGLRQLWRAITRSYLDNWHHRQMSTGQRRFFEGITRWGLLARGVVFMIIGLFLCLAAWQTDPSQAQGLGGALTVLAARPFGPWLLGAVALGLFSYGLYCLINAAFRDTSVD